MTWSTTGTRLLAGILLLNLLAGCRAIDGSYAPDCQAYAGDRMEFADGRFTWDRFTDIRRVGEDGKPLDPFPGFPKSGSYAVNGNAVELRGDDGELLSTWYLHDDDGRLLLLSADQESALDAGGGFPECALVRSESP